MIIQKIRLEHYRSHQNTEICLSKGVNLILGANGSGKSSILEAIGSVLFDINDRSGKKKGKQFIKHGEKSAKIEIEFLANDDRLYLVESPFTKSKSGVNAGKVTLKDIATGEEYEGDIQEKLQELCGIKKEYRDIYDQILIAKQNEFINIFKENPRTREASFNKIFNTQVYTEMSDTNSFLKVAEDRYTKEKEALLVEKNLLSSSLENEEELLEQYKIEEEKEKKEEFEVKKMEESKRELEKSLSSYRKSFQDLEENKKQMQHKRAKILEQKNYLRVQLQEGKKRKLARAILEEHQEAYESYQSLWKQLLKKQEEFKVLQEQEKEKQALERQNERFLWEVKKEEEECKHLDTSLEQEEEEIKLQLEDLEKSIAKKEELQKQEKIWKQLQKELVSIAQERLQSEKEQFAFQEKISFREQQISAKETEWKGMNKDSLIAQLEELEETKKKLEKDYQEKSMLEEKRNLLMEAREKLGEKFCPFLEETCGNIKNIDVNFYFSDKIALLEKDLESLEEEISSCLQIQTKEKKLREEWSRIGYLARELEELHKLQMEEGFLLEKIGLEQEKITLRQKQLLFSASFENETSLQTSLESLIGELSSLQIEEKQKNRRRVQDAFLQKKESQKQLREQIRAKKEKIEENNRKIDASLGERIEQKLRELEDLSKKQEELQEPYTKYLEHMQTAEKLEEALASISTTIQSLYQERKEIKTLLLRGKNLEEEVAKVLLEDLEEKKQSMETLLLEKSKILGIIKEKKVQYQEKLEKVRAQKQKIKALTERFQKVEAKIEKTKKIRAAIKTMGVKISKYMLESIAQAASYNFQKMTGRSESIFWSNDEKDKYAVYLVGKEGNTSFEHLSGGEQVVVAISLRESLTESFSNARFMILDEPTNNLDQERKKLLAEYMAEMLGNLDQSIIVTHDDTFREMAERVIEL